MSATVATVSGRVSLTRARVMGILFVLIGVAILVSFAGVSGASDSRFVLNEARGNAIRLPDLVVPTRGTAMFLAAVCAFLGAIQLTRGFGTKVTLVLAVVVVLFVFAFLTWAARDRSLNLLGMLQSTVLRSVPITFGALSGVLCERSGVINIGIEGMLLTAAFTGAIVGSAASSLLAGLVAGALIGGLLGALLAVLSIRYRVDQIVAGTVINILALGLTSFLGSAILARFQDLNNPGRFQNVALPFLSRIPLLGPMFFKQNIFVYLLIALVVLIHV
ncbi:MAG TPA: ABC transporter permease, partial [Actinomycetota bacterium]|nr:ABC transporter permease [Actinomycetota bacterium]